tara:strand:+ start:490 stop:675 length:186 start_codon:yes stop_codon:yes gene_type:complete
MLKMEVNKKSNKALSELMDTLTEKHISLKNEIMEKLKNLDSVESEYNLIIEELRKRNQISK